MRLLFISRSSDIRTIRLFLKENTNEHEVICLIQKVTCQSGQNINPTTYKYYFFDSIKVEESLSNYTNPVADFLYETSIKYGNPNLNGSKKYVGKIISFSFTCLHMLHFFISSMKLTSSELREACERYNPDKVYLKKFGFWRAIPNKKLKYYLFT